METSFDIDTSNTLNNVPVSKMTSHQKIINNITKPNIRSEHCHTMFGPNINSSFKNRNENNTNPRENIIFQNLLCILHVF